ncbi:hypothetical protein [Halobellus marinus]|uniref:hypothetical protein n=1 Tax=Halobellus TaxID=1073986 RepID=UPI0028AE9C93|nr:hypothetical protein [Halobellus sp. DFY28]
MSRQADSSQLAGRYIRKQGRSIGVEGSHRNLQRFQPPLTVSRDHLQCTVERLQTTIEASQDEPSI